MKFFKSPILSSGPLFKISCVHSMYTFEILNIFPKIYPKSNYNLLMSRSVSIENSINKQDTTKDKVVRIKF